MLPVGALIWLALIWLIWAQIARPTSNHLKRQLASCSGPLRPLDSAEKPQKVCINVVSGSLPSPVACAWELVENVLPMRIYRLRFLWHNLGCWTPVVLPWGHMAVIVQVLAPLHSVSKIELWSSRQSCHSTHADDQGGKAGTLSTCAQSAK